MSDETNQGSTPEPEENDQGRWGWIGGAVLIILGVIFLLQQNSILSWSWPWWALFIYLAAFANFANMWRFYKVDGHFGRKATGSLVGGLLLTDVASIFVLGGSDFGKWWPTILISIGLGIVIGGLLGGLKRP